MNGDEHFQRLSERVAIEFPDLNENQQTHICNVISNSLRKFNGDIWGVAVSSAPIDEESGCYSYEKITACNRSVYLRIQVD